MLNLNDFKTITLKDKPIFYKFYKKHPLVHSDYLFTTMISWMKYANYHFMIYKDNLLIYSNIDSQIRLRPPIGEYKKEVFDEVLKLAKKQESDFPFGMITEDKKKWMQGIYPSLKFVEHRGFFDYVYLAENLAELPGSDYSKIRNRLNKFKRNYNYNVEEINDTSIKEVKNFLKRWCLWKDCESDYILDNERKAILFSMDNFFKLNLSGILFRISGEVEAISVFEEMNKDTSVIHYEKGSPDYDGIYKAINQEAAEIIKKKSRFINRESDMDIPGLRRAKKSYRPDHMIKVYHLDKDSIKI
jgi:uncharacterized protein